MSYVFSVENMAETYPEMNALYTLHYAEMKARLEKDGVRISDLNPRLSTYFKAANEGHFLHFVVRWNGKAVGYCNVWLTGDMHNSDLIAQEDTLYVHPDHRNGVGRKLVVFGLEQLRALGVKRLHVQAMTDLRVEKLWRRMGFKPVATSMIYQFEG